MTEGSTVEHLSADELAYHQHLIAQRKAAEATWQSWAGHLSAKYQLGPKDGIGEDGTVVRAPEPTDA